MPVRFFEKNLPEKHGRAPYIPYQQWKISHHFALFLNLQIACVIVPIGQKAHHVLGLKKIITIRPIRSDVSIRL